MSNNSPLRERITSVELLEETYLVELETFLAKETLICRATFSDGTKGFGQCGNKDVDLTCLLLHRRVIPALRANKVTLSMNANGLLDEERPLEALSPIMSLVLSFELNYKMMGVQMSKAVAGVDGAIWDALSKKLNVPLHVLWREVYLRPRPSLKAIPVYASKIGRGDKNTAASLTALRKAHGITSFKIKVGERMAGITRSSGNGEEDLKEEGIAIDLVQQSLGDGCKLALDANGGFHEASEIEAICIEKNIWFLEEPLPWFMLTLGPRNAQVYSKRTLPITSASRNTQHMTSRPGRRLKWAGGEQEFRMDCAKQTITSGVFDIYQPDFGYSGGPSHVLMMCLMVSRPDFSHKVHIFPHSPQGDLHPIMALHILLARSDPECHLELACVDDALRQVNLSAEGTFRPAYVSSGGLQVTNGMCTLINPDQTGWTLTLDEAWLKDNCERKSFAIAMDGEAATVVNDAKRSFL